MPTTEKQTTVPSTINIFEQKGLNPNSKKNQDKQFKITLIILSILIVLLAIANIVVAINNQNSAPPNNDQTESSADSEEDDFEAKVQALLDQDQLDLEALNKLYDEKINEYIQDKLYGKASDLISDRTEKLLGKNLKQEALNILLKIDFSVFSKKEREYHYSQIVALAKELGDNDTAEKYEALIKDEQNNKDDQTNTTTTTQPTTNQPTDVPNTSEGTRSYPVYVEEEDDEDWDDEDWDDEDWDDEDWDDEDWDDEDWDDEDWDDEGEGEGDGEIEWDDE